MGGHLSRTLPLLAAFLFKFISVWRDSGSPSFLRHWRWSFFLGKHFYETMPNKWDGKPTEVHSVTPQMQALIDKVRNFNPE